jgi:hypothetical protein
MSITFVALRTLRLGEHALDPCEVDPSFFDCSYRMPGELVSRDLHIEENGIGQSPLTRCSRS